MELKKFADALKNAGIFPLIAGFLIQGIILLFQSLRQYLFFSSRLKSFWLFVKTNFVTVFVSNFLPGNTMGEAYKMWYLKKMDLAYLDSFSIIALDRILASLVIFMGGLAALFFVGGDILEDNIFIIGCFVVSFSIMVLLFFLLRKQISTRLEKIISIFKQVEGRLFLLAFVIACFAYILRLFKFYLILAGFGAESGFIVLAIVLFTVQISTLIPISFGSLGVMEGGIVTVLVFFGVDPSIALSTALVNRIFLYLYSFIGGGFFLQDMFGQKIKYGIKNI